MKCNKIDCKKEIREEEKHFFINFTKNPPSCTINALSPQVINYSNHLLCTFMSSINIIIIHSIPDANCILQMIGLGVVESAITIS